MSRASARHGFLLLATIGVLAVAALAPSCGGDGDVKSNGGGVGQPGGGPPFGLAARETPTTLQFPTGLPAPTPLTRDRAFPALSFSAPVFLTHPPDGTNRIFVVEQAGRIYVFPNNDAVTAGQRTLFLDISAQGANPRVQCCGEEGLLGLAFDPSFATNGAFYVSYSGAGTPRRSVIARYNVTANPNVADPASEFPILTVTQPAGLGNHKGGMIAFGPDGYLYISLGDGGGGGDPLFSGQRTNTLLGKVLRIAPRASGTQQPAYSIPPDNPFAQSTAGDMAEIWAYGIRNPWRFSFDRGPGPGTGRLWLGDVGQGAREEIDIITRGANFGWNYFEGDLTYTGTPPGGTTFAFPEVAYDRGQGSCVIGGYVYRGSRVPSLRGAYIYCDINTGRMWALVHDQATGAFISNTLVATGVNASSFGEDQAGELYCVNYQGASAGQVSRFRETTPGGGGGTTPALLSQTGIFRSLATLEVHPGLVEFDVNAPLWSDGARKRRWIALPGVSRIGFNAGGAWTFPVGTVLVKHFEIDATPGQPATAIRLETRVLVHEQAGWAGYTYVWNAAGTEADLAPAGSTSRVITINEPGGPRSQTWTFPGRSDCLSCHTAAAGAILGVRTEQVNRDFAYAATGVTDNQLRAWNHVALFDRDIGAATAYTFLPSPSDTAGATLAARARAYLAANCAQCHLPGGPAPGGLDLRAGIAVQAMNVVNVPPTEGDLGLPNARRVAPGAHASSVLWERMRVRGVTHQMPPLASNEVDPFGEDLIGDWIDAGAP